ncbi:hypothetical protein BVC71_13515 [Marivivens niveibacter]|uniref:Cadherin domain-containing protein n=1 Tax=Marivivens niveibacter TaxID=1930667 RepID=A0A251WVV1_9RHOB|nr:Ig-like domain-containing protein [Marivivens niveibacter]OUD08512.1 hypothetical protein BVC71_13515 [Marivivens niveibacter]
MARKAKFDKVLPGGSANDMLDQRDPINSVKINGGDGNDFIWSGLGDDRINGGDGDDTIDAGSGDDIIFGNDGWDTVIFAGSILDYTWADGKGNRLFVSGEDGNDELKHIEVLQFGDFTYLTNGNNGPVSVLRTQTMSTLENDDLVVDVDLYDFDGDVIMLDSFDVTGDGLVTAAVGAPVQDALMGTSTGVSFTFAPGDLYDYLAVGESTTETITLTYSDSNGAQETVSHSFNIEGVNDAVVVTSAAQAGVITEVFDNGQDENNLVHLAGDTIVFADLDLSDTHTVSFAPVDDQGDYRGDFSVTLVDDTNGGGLGTVDWAFAIDDSALEDLAQDQILTQEYSVTIDDGNGGATTQSVTVTLVGENDGPTANSDTATTLEDQAVTIDVLANDTDPDTLDNLQIVSATAASGAQVTISNGQLVYQGNANFSGTDVITYTISDGLAQSTAIATVNVEAVADTPELTVTTRSGTSPAQTIIQVSATVGDLDGSEILDRIEFSATDENGQLVDLSAYGIEPMFDPVMDGDTITQEFVLSLSPTESHNFDLQVTAVARETSNGDEATASETLEFETVYSSVSVNPYFNLTNGSIWSTGNAFSASGTYDLSASLDEHGQVVVPVLGPLNWTVAGVGLTSHFSADISAITEIDVDLSNSFSISGGAVDAGLQYHGNIESWYNATNDVLSIQTSGVADPAASYFNASIPSLGFDQSLTGFELDAVMRFVFWGYIHFHTGFASPGLTIDYGNVGAGVDLDFNLDSILGADPFSLVNFDGTTFSLLEGLYSTNFLSYANDYLSAWGTAPNFEVRSSNFFGDTLTGSNWQTFAGITFDLDAIGALIAGYPNDPLTQDFSIGVAGVSIGAEATAIDYSLVNNLSYSQSLQLDMGDLLGTVTMEDGTEFDFVFGEDFFVFDASQYDANGDGEISYDLSLNNNAALYTQGTLGVHLYDFLTAVYANVYGGINAGPINENINIEAGPAVELSGTVLDEWLAHSIYTGFALSMGQVAVDDFVFV